MSNQNAQAVAPVESQPYAESTDPTVLTAIYDAPTHMAIWKRELSPAILEAAAALVQGNPSFNISVVATPENALEVLSKSLGQFYTPELSEDLAELVEMFCMLLNVKTTYQGVATEWLPNDSVDRSKLGHGSKGKADHESGLYKNPQDIQQLQQGDVALLKGDLWDGREGFGLVHRSPQLQDQGNRLLLTLDIVE